MPPRRRVVSLYQPPARGLQLASALIVALSLPAAGGWANELAEALGCGVGEVVSDGLRCEAASRAGKVASFDDENVLLGRGTSTTGQADIAIGRNASADSINANGSDPDDYSIAIGPSAQVTGGGSIALGGNAKVIGATNSVEMDAVAVGMKSEVTGEHGVALGYAARAKDQGSMALGYEAEVSAEGGIALGYEARSIHQGSLALGAGSRTGADNTVSFGNATLKRRLTNVKAGEEADDAVTMGQLRSALGVDPNTGTLLNMLTYDDASLASASLGGSGGTVLGNLARGAVAHDSQQAINGQQLWEVKADWEARWRDMDDRMAEVERSGGGSGGGSGGVVAPGKGAGSVAVGTGSTADGRGAVAMGSGSRADGNGAVAIGEGAAATGHNSVAIGAGSSADRDNEFSVGAQGNERVVSNVAAGVRATDAVNVQQMEDRFKAEREYTDRRFTQLDRRLDRMGAISAAYAGMAINTAGLSGDNRIGAGVGAQNGRSALAVGYQRILGEKRNVSVSLGGAFSGSDQSLSAGAGFSW